MPHDRIAHRCIPLVVRHNSPSESELHLRGTSIETRLEPIVSSSGGTTSGQQISAVHARADGERTPVASCALAEGASTNSIINALDKTRLLLTRSALIGSMLSAAFRNFQEPVTAFSRGGSRRDSSRCCFRPCRACRPCSANSTDRCRGTTRLGAPASSRSAHSDRTACRGRVGCARRFRPTRAARSSRVDTSRSSTPRRSRPRRKGRSRSAANCATGPMPA